LYFTLTAWTHNLKYIKQPHIRFTDADLDMELCRYDLEGANTGTQTAVVMAKLHRADENANWQVLAIGDIGPGNAKDYTPIKGKFSIITIYSFFRIHC
jgi:stress response protein SCP2